MAKGKVKGKMKLFKPKQLMHGLLDSRCASLNSRLQSVKDDFRAFVKKLVEEIIYNSFDANYIRAYGLPGFELGIPKGKNDELTRAVAERVGKSTLVRIGNIKRVGLKIGGKITISIIKADYDDVFSLPQAEFTTGKGDKLPWMKWILTAGDVPIVQTKGWRFLRKDNKGRSGGGIMTKTSNSAKFFKVHSSYAGTDDDNWLTRAFNDSLQGGKAYFISEVENFLNIKVFS